MTDEIRPNILNLPPEVQFLFFDRLNADDLCLVSRVCRFWRTAANFDGFWEKLYYRDFGYLLTKPDPPTLVKKQMVRSRWGGWKALYATTYTETTRSKVYSSFTTHLSCPSLSYCRFWQEWSEQQTTSSYLERLLPTCLNPYNFTPSVYHFFQPYHNNNAHLNPKVPLNYVRAVHCFFFEQYWFWFFFSPSNKSQPTQILLLLSALFLPLTLLPLLLLLFMVQGVGSLPPGLLCFSFPWEPPRVEWPLPLLLATSHACVSPLLVWSTLVLLHKSPYQELTKEDSILKGTAMLVTVLIVQFILSSWGVSMTGFICQLLLLAFSLSPCILAISQQPVAKVKLVVGSVCFMASVLVADEWLAVVSALLFIFFFPIWFSLLPQKTRRRGDGLNFLAECQSMKWHNINCSAVSIYLIATLPLSYLAILYYGYVGL